MKVRVVTNGAQEIVRIELQMALIEKEGLEMALDLVITAARTSDQIE
ncbi:MAG: hypothetical protein R3A47_02665 [Polyangiales bacterium]